MSARRESPLRRIPYATIGIIILCLAAFVLVFRTQHGHDQDVRRHVDDATRFVEQNPGLDASALAALCLEPAFECDLDPAGFRDVTVGTGDVDPVDLAQQEYLDRRVEDATDAWAASPVARLGLSRAVVHPWAPVTHLFLHKGFLSLLATLVALWLAMSPMEARWGAARAVTVFLFTGAMVGLAQLALLGARPHHLVLGAAGGVGALVGLLLVSAQRDQAEMILPPGVPKSIRGRPLHVALVAVGVLLYTGLHGVLSGGILTGILTPLIGGGLGILVGLLLDVMSRPEVEAPRIEAAQPRITDETPRSPPAWPVDPPARVQPAPDSSTRPPARRSHTDPMLERSPLAEHGYAAPDGGDERIRSPESGDHSRSATGDRSPVSGDSGKSGSFADSLEVSFPVQFGRFRLTGIAGTGGMSTVYRAVLPGPMGFEKDLVLKVIRSDLLEDEVFERTLVNEALLGCQLHHPNVVEIFEFDRIQERYYLAMEFIDGISLSYLIKRQRKLGQPLPHEVVLHLVGQVLDGLDYAHNARAKSDGALLGVVHRDLKPANIAVADQGRVKILDFGIARVAKAAEGQTTRSIRGTPRFMSPEQIRRPEEVGPPSDLFSLGAVFYELVALRPLFWDGPDSDPLLLVLEMPLQERIQEADASMPGLGDILSRMLTRPLEKRLASAAEVRTALRPLTEEYADPDTAAKYLQARVDEFREQSAQERIPEHIKPGFATGREPFTWHSLVNLDADSDLHREVSVEESIQDLGATISTSKKGAPSKPSS